MVTRKEAVGTHPSILVHITANYSKQKNFHFRKTISKFRIPLLYVFRFHVWCTNSRSIQDFWFRMEWRDLRSYPRSCDRSSYLGIPLYQIVSQCDSFTWCWSLCLRIFSCGALASHWHQLNIGTWFDMITFGLLLGNPGAGSQITGRLIFHLQLIFLLNCKLYAFNKRWFIILIRWSELAHLKTVLYMALTCLTHMG